MLDSRRRIRCQKVGRFPSRHRLWIGYLAIQPDANRTWQIDEDAAGATYRVTVTTGVVACGIAQDDAHRLAPTLPLDAHGVAAIFNPDLGPKD